MHLNRSRFLHSLPLLLHPTALYAFLLLFNSTLLWKLDSAAIGLNLLLSIRYLLDEIMIVDDSLFLCVVTKHLIDILTKLRSYIGLHDHAALGYSLEEISLGEVAVIDQVKELKCLEEEGIQTLSGLTLLLYLLQ